MAVHTGQRSAGHRSRTFGSYTYVAIPPPVAAAFSFPLLMMGY